MVRQTLLTALTVSLMLCLPLADSYGRGFGGGGRGGGGGGGGGRRWRRFGGGGRRRIWRRRLRRRRRTQPGRLRRRRVRRRRRSRSPGGFGGGGFGGGGRSPVTDSAPGGFGRSGLRWTRCRRTGWRQDGWQAVSVDSVAARERVDFGQADRAGSAAAAGSPGSGWRSVRVPQPRPTQQLPRPAFGRRVAQPRVGGRGTRESWASAAMSGSAAADQALVLAVLEA